MTTLPMDSTVKTKGLGLAHPRVPGAPVLCVLGMAITGQMGQMTWHFRLGYALAALLLFGMMWGKYILLALVVKLAG